MHHSLSQQQVNSYQQDGFLVVDQFLTDEELAHWRETYDQATADREGQRFSNNSDDARGQVPGAFYSRVFDQMVNLWQTNPEMGNLILDQRIAGMAAALAGVDGLRVWHDQALRKKPFANHTAFHLDAPYWSFTDPRAISIWIALDDATAENGCLYFFPGSHEQTTTANSPIGENLDAIFDIYPDFRDRPPTIAKMKAGSCSFHSGMAIHGAGANLTHLPRRAMTCAYMPDGATFNGQQNILTDEQVAQLSIGDLLNDENQNPLVFQA